MGGDTHTPVAQRVSKATDLNSRHFAPVSIHLSYCRPPNFGRSEQEHKHKGDENKSAKYGLTAFKDQITVHLRLYFWKHLSENRAVRELMNGGLPWLPFYG